MPAGLVRRAEIVLRSADGQTHRAIAEAVGVSLSVLRTFPHGFLKIIPHWVAAA
jgi:hypothetical protein